MDLIGIVKIKIDQCGYQINSTLDLCPVTRIVIVTISGLGIRGIS